MSSQPSMMQSILYIKCPRCRQGNLFTEQNPYVLNKLFDMHDKCPHCELNFELEVGFYYGSMYVSYGLAVALSVAVFVATTVISFLAKSEIDFILYLILNSLTLLFAAPYMYRFSRAVWINFFVKYAPDERGKFIRKNN
jgi:hypothetical protein